jgi:hypothetical protein
MQTTENRGRCDSIVTWNPMTAGVADRVVDERTFRNTRSQTRVRAAAIVVCDPLVENRAKVPLVQGNHEIQAVPTENSIRAADSIRRWSEVCCPSTVRSAASLRRALTRPDPDWWLGLRELKAAPTDPKID